MAQAFSKGAELTHDQLMALVEALWAEPVHERRMAAVALLELHPRCSAPPTCR